MCPDTRSTPCRYCAQTRAYGRCSMRVSPPRLGARPRPGQTDRMATNTTLYRGGHVYSPADPTATAGVVADNTIAWPGNGADAPAAGGAVDPDGPPVTP